MRRRAIAVFLATAIAISVPGIAHAQSPPPILGPCPFGEFDPFGPSPIEDPLDPKPLVPNVSPTPPGCVSNPTMGQPPSVEKIEEEDPPPWWDLPGRSMWWLKKLLAQMIAWALEPVFGAMEILFTTPELDKNERVKTLWSFSLGIGDAALIVFALAAAGVVMTSGSFEGVYSAKELMPRILGAAAASNLSFFALGQMISWSNALSRGFLRAASDPSAIHPLPFIGKVTEIVLSALAAKTFLLLLAVVVVGEAVFLIAQFVIRIIVLVLLAVSAPLLLVTYSLPQSETLARVWWRATFASLGIPVIQSLLVAMAFRIFWAGDGFLGFFAGSAFIDLMFVVCLMYLLIKVNSYGMSAAWSALQGGSGNKLSRRYKQAHMAIRAAKGATKVFV